MYQESVGNGFSCSTRVVGHQHRGEVHLRCSFSEIDWFVYDLALFFEGLDLDMFK